MSTEKMLRPTDRISAEQRELPGSLVTGRVFLAARGTRERNILWGSLFRVFLTRHEKFALTKPSPVDMLIVYAMNGRT